MRTAVRYKSFCRRRVRGAASPRAPHGELVLLLEKRSPAPEDFEQAGRQPASCHPAAASWRLGPGGPFRKLRCRGGGVGDRPGAAPGAAPHKRAGRPRPPGLPGRKGDRKGACTSAAAAWRRRYSLAWISFSLLFPESECALYRGPIAYAGRDPGRVCN